MVRAVNSVLWCLILTHCGVVETNFASGIYKKENEKVVEVRMVGTIGSETGLV